MSFLIGGKKDNTLFTRLIAYNNFSYINIDDCLIRVNLNNLLILFNLIKSIEFNNYINIVNEIL